MLCLTFSWILPLPSAHRFGSPWNSNLPSWMGERISELGKRVEQNRQVVVFRKVRMESTKSESRMVAENLLRDRLGKVERGLAVGEMKKLKYEDIRTLLILDYRTRSVKMLEQDKDGNPHVWGFEHLDPFFKARLVTTITTDLL